MSLGVFTSQSTLKQKIFKQPTIAFFALTFLISWISWFLAPVIGGSDKALTDAIDLIAAFGPSLSAIIIASIINPEPSNASSKKRIITFAAIFVVLFTIQIIALLVTFDFRLLTVSASMVVSIMPAYVISSIYHPRQGVAQLMSGLKRVSPRNVWIWVAVLLPFIWQFLGALLDLGFGGKELLSFSIYTLVVVLFAYPLTFFFGGPLNEEPGWRGFATPRMQQHFTPLVTGLLIGVIWTIWHFPLHVTAFYGDGLEGFLFRFLFNVPLGVLFTWYYNRSSGNLFGCILLHASVNTASGVFGQNASLLTVGVMIAFAVAVVFIGKMYRKHQNVVKIEKETVSLTTV